MKIYKCEKCNKEFDSHQKLGGHKSGHNRKLKSFYPTEKQKCLMCNKKVNSFYNNCCSKKCAGLFKQSKTLRKVKGKEINVSNLYILEYRKKYIVCEICGIKENKKLCVDHDHKNNKFRGLLCSLCNRQLGWFENNKDNILKYLNK